MCVGEWKHPGRRCQMDVVVSHLYILRALIIETGGQEKKNAMYVLHPIWPRDIHAKLVKIAYQIAPTVIVSVLHRLWKISCFASTRSQMSIVEQVVTTVA